MKTIKDYTKCELHGTVTEYVWLTDKSSLHIFNAVADSPVETFQELEDVMESSDRKPMMGYTNQAVFRDEGNSVVRYANFFDCEENMIKAIMMCG